MHDTEKKTILLVEDEAIIAVSEKLMLERYGYSVISVSSGEKAIALFKEPHTVDLVLMDIDLGPGIDGTQAAESILKDQDVPIVFFSSHSEPEVVRKTEKITSYGYVVKNSNSTVLDASIKMAFKLFESTRKNLMTKTKLEAMLNALPDLLFEVGLDGCYYDFYSPHTELLYKPVSDLIGRTIREILPENVANIVMAAIHEANETGSSTGSQYELAVPEGSRWFEISVSRLTSGSDNPHFIFLSRDITAHKKLEEKLSITTQLLEQTFEQSPLPMVLVGMPGAVFRIINPACREFLGILDEPSYIGTSLHDFKPSFIDMDVQGNRSKIDDLPLMRSLSGEKTVNEERRVVRKDGTTRWELVSATPIFDEAGKIIAGYLAMNDITERRQSEAALRASEEKLNRIVSKSSELICEIDDRGRYTFLSDSYESVVGYKPEELLGQPVSDLIHPDDLKIAASEFEWFKDKRENSTNVWRFKDKSGKYRYFECHGSSYSSESGRPTTVVISHDITNRLQSEKKIENLLAEKELILREVHHRIKNNMYTIKSLLSLQARTSRDQTVMTALHDAESRVQSMMVLYQTLYESNNFSGLSFNMYLPSLVSQITRNFPNGESVKVITDIDDFQLDSKVMQPLGILINELLTNIMKYAFEGRSGGTIYISAKLSGRHVVIGIHDDGNGIPESVDFENTSGFGLMLVGMLTKQLEGTIRIERGGGTKIILEFDT